MPISVTASAQAAAYDLDVTSDAIDEGPIFSRGYDFKVY
jgi:hypothetical protein